MAVLRIPAAALGVLLCLPRLWAETPCLFSEWDFSGCVQGRVLGIADGPGKPQGPLNDLPNPDYAGGQAETQALIQRLEFALSSKLPWSGWSVLGSAGLTGSQSVIQDAYLSFQPNRILQLRLGRFRVPFGLEPQTPSAGLDLPERALVYHFGNFGWVGPAGMEFVSERDIGLRADGAWPPGFAGFAPQFAAGLVLGNGRDVLPHLPPQFLGRIGVSSRAEVAGLRHELSFGFSGSCGENRFARHSERYLPLGAAGDLQTNPAEAVTADDLGDQGLVSVLGMDAVLRMNDLRLQAEGLTRKVRQYTSQGYYVTAAWEQEGLPLAVLLRWEEAVQGYADGVHVPNRIYQAATAGINIFPAADWKIQAAYMALLQDFRQHVFPGSDLIILQAQWVF